MGRGGNVFFLKVMAINDYCKSWPNLLDWKNQALKVLL